MVRAAMIFNGWKPDEIDELDEETFNELIVMWHDGLVGVRGVLEGLAVNSSLIYNVNRGKNEKPVTAKDFIQHIDDYFRQVKELNNSPTAWKAFILQLPGAPNI